MKGHSTWQSKKGSIFYGVMILILCSSLLVHQNRLILSHLYIERGIYSMDVEIEAFHKEMKNLEVELNNQFETFSHFSSEMNKNKSIKIFSFEIIKDSMYNEYNILMLKVTDKRVNIIRRVMAQEIEGEIILVVREV